MLTVRSFTIAVRVRAAGCEGHSRKLFVRPQERDEVGEVLLRQLLV